MTPLGPCAVCGEMVYEDEGDVITKDGAEVAEHFDCEEDE